MNQYEWTLSGRVNCKEDEKPSSEETDGSPSTVPMMKLEPAITSYYSMTAPVHVKFCDLEPCHSVSVKTETVIVDMRYKFNSSTLTVYKNGVPMPGCETSVIVDKVADKIRELVTDHLISKEKRDNYR